MTYPRKLVIATTNQGKLKEFQQILSNLKVELLSLKDFPQIGEIIEDGTSFKENALIKAKKVMNETGLVSLADDSGLEVDFLEGEPGINSARFSGLPVSDERNNRKLLELLEGVPLAKRTANFRSFIAILTPDNKEYLAEGSCAGLILEKPRGHQGFGYDPLFYLPQYGQTFAELSLDNKNSISHRGQAVEKARSLLEKIF